MLDGRFPHAPAQLAPRSLICPARMRITPLSRQYDSLAICPIRLDSTRPHPRTSLPSVALPRHAPDRHPPARHAPRPPTTGSPCTIPPPVLCHHHSPVPMTLRTTWNMCNIKHLNATYVWNRWNIWNIQLQHMFENICNIRIEHLQFATWKHLLQWKTETNEKFETYFYNICAKHMQHEIKTLTT
jgi:hypothetical protein